jgi:hypothetical protein
MTKVIRSKLKGHYLPIVHGWERMTGTTDMNKGYHTFWFLWDIPIFRQLSFRCSFILTTFIPTSYYSDNFYSHNFYSDNFYSKNSFISTTFILTDFIPITFSLFLCQNAYLVLVTFLKSEDLSVPTMNDGILRKVDVTSYSIIIIL